MKLSVAQLYTAAKLAKLFGEEPFAEVIVACDPDQELHPSVWIQTERVQILVRADGYSPGFNSTGQDLIDVAVGHDLLRISGRQAKRIADFFSLFSECPVPVELTASSIPGDLVAANGSVEIAISRDGEILETGDAKPPADAG